jgi:hypothetical protein
VAGPQAIAPHFERYGICLVAPSMLLLARGLVWWMDESPWPQLSRRAVLVGGWLWLVSFDANYFVFMRQTGGESHVAFRTAAVEPKLQTLELVRAMRDPSRTATIVCRSWWTYWPIAYLTAGTDDLGVMTLEQWSGIAHDSRPDQAWFVEFVDEAASAPPSVSGFSGDLAGLPRQTIRDYCGRPLIVVSGPRANSSHHD